MPSPRELPMAKLAFALIFGILLGSLIDFKIYSLVVTFGLSFSVLLFLQSLRRLGLVHIIRSCALYVNVILIGLILLTNAQNRITNSWLDANQCKTQMAVTCQSIPKEGKSTRILTKVTHVKQESDVLEAIRPVFAYINIYDFEDTIRVGDQLVLNAKLTHSEGARNPLAFDYARYLKFQGVGYQSFINGKDIIKKTFSPSPLNFVNGKMRAYALDLFQQHLSGDNLAVASALVLGYRELITDELDGAFADTGSTHVLAVSGLHVGIVSFGIGLLLLLLPSHNTFWKTLQVLLLILGITLFAVLTGGSPSVFRASVMFGALQVSKIITGKYCIYNSIGASAFVMLLWDPLYLFQVSFQLSYAAILSIIFFYPKIYSLLTFEDKLLDKLWRMTVIALSVQVLTLPIAVFYFHQFPLTFLISGITAVALASSILGIGLITIILSIFLDVEILFVAYDFLISGLVHSTYLINEIPYTLIENIHLDKIGFVLLLMAMSCLGIYGLYAKRKFAIISLAFLCLLFGYINFDKVNKMKKSEIIVYNSKYTLVDVIHGGICYSYADPRLSEQNMHYATENYRRASRINEVVNLNSNEDLYKLLRENNNLLVDVKISNYENNRAINDIADLQLFIDNQDE